jgi:hypothetical protein
LEIAPLFVDNLLLSVVEDECDNLIDNTRLFPINNGCDVSVGNSFPFDF